MIDQDLEKLFALQKTDLALDDVASREAAARTRLKEDRDSLERFKAEVAAEKKALDEVLKEHKLKDLDLKKLEEQIKKHSLQMYEVKTNKEYSALKDEIDKAKAECQVLEDAILRMMMKEDEFRAANTRRQAELAERGKASGELEARIKKEVSDLEAQRKTLKARREEEAGRLSPNLLQRYEKIRSLRGGSPVALVIEAPGGKEVVCSECHITIRPQIIVEISKKEELVACESCGRILSLDVAVSIMGGGAGQS